MSLVWWLISTIPVVGTLRQEHHHEFEASLVYIERCRPVTKTVSIKKTYKEADISVYEIVYHKMC